MQAHDPNRPQSPPEVPVTPMPAPEIEPSQRPEPEVPALPPDTFDPIGPQGPEIIPNPAPPEFPVPGEAARMGFSECA